jgi:hypothetical protein
VHRQRPRRVLERSARPVGHFMPVAGVEAGGANSRFAWASDPGGQNASSISGSPPISPVASHGFRAFVTAVTGRPRLWR